MMVKRGSVLKSAGWKHLVMILFFITFIGACGKEKAPSPSSRVPIAQTDSSTPPASAKAAPAEPEPTVTKVQNLPPKIDSVKLAPDIILPGTSIRAIVEANDPEGDLVMLDYVWKRNGQLIKEAIMDELDTTGFAKGDLVAVAVTPLDGNQKGEAKLSLPVVILDSPPRITSFPPAAVSNGTYSYPVIAEDPDGDKLKFSLEEAPSGMTIEADSGRLEWNVPGNISGTFPVRVIVSDGDARAFQGFSLNLIK